jgi:hypothetical protein
MVSVDEAKTKFDSYIRSNFYALITTDLRPRL